MRTRYHTPGDDMNQALDFGAAARYTRLAFVTGYFPPRLHSDRVGTQVSSLLRNEVRDYHRLSRSCQYTP